MATFSAKVHGFHQAPYLNFDFQRTALVSEEPANTARKYLCSVQSGNEEDLLRLYSRRDRSTKSGLAAFGILEAWQVTWRGAEGRKTVVL